MKLILIMTAISILFGVAFIQHAFYIVVVLCILLIQILSYFKIKKDNKDDYYNPPL